MQTLLNVLFNFARSTYGILSVPTQETVNPPPVLSTMLVWIMYQTISLILTFFFKITLNTVAEYVYIYKTCLKKAQIICTETWLKPDFWWLWWEFSFLICPMVKVSPWANLPWDGKGPPCQSSAAGGGSAKASHGQLISLENQFTDHVGRFAN